MTPDDNLIRRITTHPDIFGGKPVVRGRRLAVEHVLGMLAAGDTTESLLAAYPGWRPTTFGREQAARTWWASNQGYAARSDSVVSQAASIPSTCSTASHRPRTTGLPPKMSGCVVIRRIGLSSGVMPFSG